MNLLEALWVFLISAAPIVELRLAIPIAINEYNIAWYYAFPICVAGNLLPVPFILLFLGPISDLMSRISIFDTLIQWVFKYTRRRGGLVEKYGPLGLILLVAIPLPVTGAWTGSLVAFLLGIDFKSAFYCIFVGVIIAGIIVTILSLLGWTGAIIASAALFIFVILHFWRRMRQA
jgi:uncharacterized membrane protein